MIGKVSLPVDNVYVLNRHPLLCDGSSCYLKVSVYDGEFVNVYECSELEKFYKVESLDHQKSGYIHKSCIKICELGKDIGFPS